MYVGGKNEKVIVCISKFFIVFSPATVISCEISFNKSKGDSDPETPNNETETEDETQVEDEAEAEVVDETEIDDETETEVDDETEIVDETEIDEETEVDNDIEVDTDIEVETETEDKKTPEPINSNEYNYFVNYNQYLNDFNLGVNHKSYKDYQNHNKVSRLFQLSDYIPTNTFLHKDDIVKVYLNKSKTTAAEREYILKTNGIFQVGLYGQWSTSFEHVFEASTKISTIGSILVKPVEIEDNDYYVFSFSTPNPGILFHHIASTLFIEKVLVNGLENDPSRTNLIYNRDPKSGPVDTNYGAFWKKLYQKLDKFQASNYDINQQLVNDTPFIILKSEKFNLIIDSVKMFLIMQTAKNDGIFYNDNNLNSALLAMDWNYNLSNEINGLSSQGLGDYNFEYDFQKENIIFSDDGYGLFYSTSKYFAMHSSLGKELLNFNATLTSESDFYKRSQFTSSFTGKGGVGFKKSDSQTTENIVEYFSQGMWGLQHEFGHTFQVGGYKLSKWGEVTVNIGPVGITQLLYKYNLIKPIDSGFYDQVYRRLISKKLTLIS
ncbi:hypothetical protein SCLARK_00504 [Spiroplasma clarkii]|uniref:Peptidase M60 domain-containing protein n=1 Tax=Spiroplasma clarkii TaxID=2139 RepID=A0A1Y0L0F9_9MOLU|nr:M60 family metallopeptidase [Spiroplasma clarkii]ARU91198.1 hypothetical protein SCLARK_00504 [Spiroplasma clarkii]ATX70638.1 hypothetical protein SCLAR_v1c03080 [Spiroplasma clarkii]